MNRLKIDDNFIKNLQVICKYQTPIDNKRADSFITEWNRAIEMIGDDLQTLYRELSIILTERFLRGHLLIDGNKRMHRYMMNFLIDNISNDDIL